jgi:anti-sigma factor (TIGR02949 family)
MPSIDYETCKRVFQLLDDYLDRELGPEDLDQIERHLEVCAHCAQDVRLAEGSLRAVRSKLGMIAIPAALHARVWQITTRARRGTPDSADRRR